MDLSSLFAAPVVMGILNCTPDSFHDGAIMGRLDDGERVAKGLALVAAGAAIVDVGGESTRPGATPVSAAAETARVVPVIRGLRRQSAVAISVDTRHAATAAAALDAGADIVNDICAANPAVGGDPEMLAVAARAGAPMVLMHSTAPGADPRPENRYPDVAAAVLAYLDERLERARERGIAAIADPGFGFGKTWEENWALFRALPALCAHWRATGAPTLIGVSHKRMFARVRGDRGPASARAAALAVARGAAVVRVHDVATTVAALRRAGFSPRNHIQ